MHIRKSSDALVAWVNGVGGGGADVVEIPKELDLFVLTANKELLSDFYTVLTKMDLLSIFRLSVDIWNFKTTYHFPPQKLSERAQRIVTKWFERFDDQNLITRYFPQKDEILTLKKNVTGNNKINVKVFDGIWFTIKALLQKAYMTLGKGKFGTKYKLVTEHSPKVNDNPTTFSTELFGNNTFMEKFCEYVELKGQITYFELLVLIYNFEKKICLSQKQRNTDGRSICVDWFGFGGNVTSFEPKVEWTEEQKILIKNLLYAYETSSFTQSNHNIVHLSSSSLERARKVMRRTTKGAKDRQERNRTNSGGLSLPVLSKSKSQLFGKIQV